MIRYSVILICLIFLISGCGPQYDQPRYFNKTLSSNNVTIATGGKYGPYFIIGSALAEIYSTHLNMNATVQTTGGSVENLYLLEQKKADLAFVMADVALTAYEGKGNFTKPFKDLRVMTGLYINYVQIITLASSGINNVNDLVGKKVGIGASNSGVEVNARMILQGYGLQSSDFEPYPLSYYDSMERLKNGEIDAAFVTSGLPNAPVVELSKEKELKILPIFLSEMNQEGLSPYFMETTIPAYTYGNKEPVKTVGIQNLLLARKDLSEAKVFNLTATLYSNIAKLQTKHEAMVEVSSSDSVPNLPIPLHNGAKAYFQNKKLNKIPWAQSVQLKGIEHFL